MRISDWSSDVCSSDLQRTVLEPLALDVEVRVHARRERLEYLGGPGEANQVAPLLASDRHRDHPTAVGAGEVDPEGTEHVVAETGSVTAVLGRLGKPAEMGHVRRGHVGQDRKSTRLNSSH